MDASNPSETLLATLFTDQNNMEDSHKVNTAEWLNRINKAREKEARWRERATKCIRIFRDDSTDTSTTYTSPRTDDGEVMYNILWANTEVLKPALFSAIPKPDVRNRYLTQDPVAKTAGQIIERCLSYSLDMYQFDEQMNRCVLDYLLPGRGVVRVRLIPTYEEVESITIDLEGNEVVTVEEKLIEQAVTCERVPWKSFVVDPADNWDDVNWIAFIHMLSQEEFEKFFPGETLTVASTKDTQFSVDPKYQVYEIWDKTKKKVYYIGQSDKPLKVLDDPLQLTHFWPVPEPLYSIKTNDTLVPIPEYTIYQQLANELNLVSYRIADLIKSCKFIGVYDSMQPMVSDLLTGRDSQFVPVASNLLRDGGIRSVIDVVDTSQISAILAALYKQRDQILSIIYQITGISDIIRGDTSASETATAQNIKARYAGLRLRDRREAINRFIVDILRMQSELISRFFTIEQMQQMSGIEVTPEVEQLIRENVLQSYRIDVESDSTVMADMEEEAQKRAALVASITQFIGTVAPLVQQGALPLETAKALLIYALQPTKISRELEDALEMIGSQPPAPAAPQMDMMQPVGMDQGLPPELMAEMPPELGNQQAFMP